ncbi:indole-3-glycerol phosphate synthase TrpC [Candidatus Viridilinea mediisalina]|uniref:Indole-3-glycerol phosphate synthase n=1 Tax=Candidatus Viridilinea mediisalina TaxID=2024553 RepID=A0A2A6RL81_9CHLR|nr:indole-3-glycerol phosphate synthase TrpC [Candidatus Viridilinea mediisalina]PDW03649.1 indole-3-glycerol phosphate synthase [Candidatus Viridilinea mediisalina]
MSEPTILAKILTHKAEEVARQRSKVALAALEERCKRAAAVRDFALALRCSAPATALIAEVKKASPSRGVLREPFDHLELARSYRDAGAAALSVLTDGRFFQGSLKYLEGIRQLAKIPPLLRKDFILDPYQIYEARAYGADALLLIVAALEDSQLHELLALTHELGMAALVEVHTSAEMERALALGAKLIGVNNRDLHSFTTSLATTGQLAQLLPSGPERPLLVSESGIFTPEHVAQVRAYGADAILVGEALVTAPDVAAQTAALVAA